MFNAIKEFFLGKPVQAPKVEEVPYKVEVAPVIQDYSDIAIAQMPAPVKAAPVKAPAKAPAKAAAVKKPAAPKKPAGGKKSGRKPKA